MRQSKRQLLVIDPYPKFPEVEAFNYVVDIFQNCLKRFPDLPFETLRYVSPSVPYPSMDETALSESVGAVIGLGSEANVTEAPEWFPRYAHWVRTLAFERKIPFFGICFAHQAIAHLQGVKVDYISNRLHQPGIKYELPRQIDVSDKRLQKLLGNKQKFWSHVIHEQEVLGVPNGFASAAQSPVCQYEAFVHESLPIFTVQCHPETPHESGDGARLLENFLLFAAEKNQ